jgi:Flp pilus assembly protein TadD
MPGLTFADPAAVQAVLREGLARHRDGDFASAEAAYRRVIEVMPELPDALHLLGAIFLQTDRHEAAADQFTKALALNPDNSLAHANIGLAFYELGRHQEAETAYGRAIALDPDLQQAHSNLGRLYVRMNRLDDAEAAVAKAFRLAPGPWRRQQPGHSGDSPSPEGKHRRGPRDLPRARRGDPERYSRLGSQF